MLKIIIADSNIAFKQELVMDVEKEFSKLKITGNAIDKLLIEQVEKGKYNDINSYIDRFGYKLHYDDMSTGCKAALCVVNLPDKIISLAECGHNARDIIIALCKTGNILMDDDGLTISTEYGNDIEVIVDGHTFRTIDSLNKYISDQRVLR